MPILGAVFRLAAVAADLAAIGESVAESLASPAIYSNTLLLTQSTTVTVDHDPNDFQFVITSYSIHYTKLYDVRAVRAIRPASSLLSVR